MVTISAPRKANITPSMATMTDDQPLGMKPPWAVRLAMPCTVPPCQMLRTASRQMMMKQTMAVTLISANQNSNSP